METYLFSAPTGQLPPATEIAARWADLHSDIDSTEPPAAAAGGDGPAAAGAVEVIVVATTAQYHALARALPKAGGHAVEIGCAYGDCTKILAAGVSATAIGIDISSECVAECGTRCPGLDFKQIDCMGDGDALAAALAVRGGCDSLFIDINGNRSATAVSHLIEFAVARLGPPGLIAVKCSDLHKILYRHRFGARAQRPHPTRPNRGIAGDAVVIDDQGKVGSTTVAAATPHHEATAQQPKPTFLAVDGATEVMADEARRYAKVCTVCKRMIVWRSKFSKCWPTLKYCSHECRGTVADAELCEVVVSNKKWTAMTSAPAAVGVAAKFEAK